MALLLPPFRAGQGGHAPLDSPRERKRRAPHLRECPALFDPHVDVHAARTAGFRPAAKPEFLEKRLHFESDFTYIRPLYAWHWIQVDAKFVRVVEIAGAHGMRMKFDAAQ